MIRPISHFTLLLCCLSILVGCDDKATSPQLPSTADMGIDNADGSMDETDDTVINACLRDTDCADTEYCERPGAGRGECRIGCREEGCGEGELCDLDTRACVPEPCSSDDGCESGEYCADDGACTEGCRVEPDNCEINEETGRLTQCNADTRSCEEIVVCCGQDTSCTAGPAQACTGQLMMGAQSCSQNPCGVTCMEDSDCDTDVEELGRFCNLQDNRCRDGCRLDNPDSCGEGQQCNPETRICEDIPCGVNDDCPPNRYCNFEITQGGLCALGCRDNSSCEATEVCNENTRLCEVVCNPEDPTTCPDTQYCNESNRCVDKCETHDDCESNQFCDPTDQQCKSGCRDDEGDNGEPNDTRADAITIPLTAADQDGIQFGSIEGLVLCENNPDVFRVDVGPGKRLRVTVTYDQVGAGGFTLDGVGPQQSCRFMADCAEGLLWTCDDRVCTSPQQVVTSDGQEAMVEYPPLPGTGLDAEGKIVTDETSYYITVEPDTALAFRYRVDVAVADATTSCFPDAREAEAGDDVRTNGTEIMVGGTTTRYTFNGTACGMDKDWFKLNLNPNDGLNIDLRRIDGDDLDLIILPANQSVGGTDATTADSSTLPFSRNVDDNAFLPGGEWHVRVSSTNSESASYELELTHSPSNPCAGGDQGDTIMDASVIALNPGGEYEVGVSGTPEENLNNENTQICNEGARADVDYFCFETGAQEKIEAWLLSANPMTAAEGEVAVQFTDGSGNLIGSEALSTNGETVQKARYLGTQAGTYCARVAGVSGRDGDYRLFLSRTESSGEQCALDMAESTGPRNDRASSATVLTEDANRPGYYEFGDGYICDLMRSDEDWYKVNIPEVRSGICVLVDGFDASRADVDLAVYQSAVAAGDNCTAQGQARCDAANGAGGACVPTIDGATSYCTPANGDSIKRFDFEMVQVPRYETGDISGDFYIKVGHRDITEGPYTLSVNVNPNSDNCAPDPNETNNSLETAQFLGAGTAALCDSWVCNGERDDARGDWFSIDVPAGEDRTVLITYSDTEGTLHAKINAAPRMAEDGTILDDPDSDQGSGKHQSTFDAGGRQCFIIKGGTTLNPVHFQTYVSDLISPITWDSNRIDYSVRVFPTDLEANPNGLCNEGLPTDAGYAACPLYEQWMPGSLGHTRPTDCWPMIELP